MRAPRLGTFAILALISSCVSFGSGEPDTADVASLTRGIELAEEAAKAEVPGHHVGSPARFVGFAGSRFSVFDTNEHTVVVDHTTARTFSVYGHPIAKRSTTLDDLALAGFSTPASRLVASSDGKTMLVTTDAGVHAVDLEARGALLAGWRGQPDHDAISEEVELSPDGSVFAVWSDGLIHLVRTSDGARKSWPYGEGDHEIVVTPSAIHWTDASGVRLVDRATLEDHLVPKHEAHVVSSKDGTTFVVWNDATSHAPAHAEIWHLGEDRYRARIASLQISDVVVADDGARVAWSEWSGAAGAPTYLHTVDVTSGVHARFVAKGALCEIGPERVVGFEDGALKTDAECNPGCGSIETRPQLLTYDPATGRQLRSWSGAVVAPFNDSLAAHSAVATALAERFGLERNSDNAYPLVVPPPNETPASAPSSVVVVRDAELVVAAADDGRVLFRLPRSAGFTADSVVVTPDGTRVIATDERRIVVWNAENGTLVSSNDAPRASVSSIR
jgi:hypothetical protein